MMFNFHSIKLTLFVVFTLLPRVTKADDILNDPTTLDRICSVFCSGPILEGVQMAQLFDDSKTFVDMPLLVDPEEALEAWSSSFTQEEISAFVSTYFTDAGSELLPTVPADWKQEPPLLSRIANETMSKFAYDLNQIWLELYREMDEAVFENPQRYSILRRRHGLVLPGGRFRETYYWDSYWIVRGLILSDMLDTATGVVQNLLDDVTDFGFVPNGGRAYYTNRSQPPFLSLMVKDVTRSKVLASDNQDDAGESSWQSFLEKALPNLETEMGFWKSKRNVESCGNLSQYFSSSTSPRPESYVEDVNTQEASIRHDIYAQLCAGAETGWDFSTRWIIPTVVSDDDGKEEVFFELENITTTSMVPIDLNSVIYRAQLSLAWLYELNQRQTLLDSSNQAIEGRGDNGDVLSDGLFTSALVEDWLDIDERCLLDLNTINNLSPSSACSDEKYNSVHIYSEKATDHLQQALELRTTIEEFLWLPQEGRWADGLLSWNNSYMFKDDDNNSANPNRKMDDNNNDDENTDDVVKRRSSGDVCTAITKGSVHDVTSISGWSAPLWAGLGVLLDDEEKQLVMSSLLKGADIPLDANDDGGESGLIQPGGVRTTVMDKDSGGQQWDSPNSWAPLQLMLVIGLEHIGELDTANLIARRWLNSNLLGWADGQGNMFEKYDAFQPGVYGGGGEYEPQSGFGWTNGVALELIERNYATGDSLLS